jgi:hypothetical protein
MKERISIQEILMEIESSRKEINNSKNRVIIFLLVSSVISIFWSTSILSFNFFYSFRIFITFPFIFNISAWIIYLLQYLTPFLFNHIRYLERENRDIDNEDREIIWKSQMITASRIRQSKIERMIIPIIILQFISMSAILMMIFQIR